MSKINNEPVNRTLDYPDRLDDGVKFAAASSAAGRAWIADLPALIHAVCQRWGLEIEDGVAENGYHAIVLPVRRSEASYVLKLTWPATRDADQPRALAAWDGYGAVRLIEADTEVGAMLLERLDSRRTLRDLNLSKAAAIGGRLLRQLAVPAPPGFRQLIDLVRDLTTSLDARQKLLGDPVPGAWIDAARSLCRTLEDLTSNRFLIHGDLHYGNILAGEREPWLAIDPRPIAGDPEYAVPELLWSRVDEIEDAEGIRRLLAVIVENGMLDAEKARSWSIVRCVDYWLWGIEHGLTEDPKLCQRIPEALI